MNLHFTTDSVPQRHQLESWREAICDTFLRLDIAASREGRTGFSGQIVRHQHKIFSHAEVIAEAHQAVRPSGQFKDTGEDCFMVLIQRAGNSQIEQDGRSVLMRPGQFAVCDSTRAYSMILPTGFHHEVIQVPGALLRACISRTDRLTARAIDGTRGLGKFFLDMVETCRDPSAELTLMQAEGVSRSLVNLLAIALDSTLLGEGKVPTNLEVYHLQRIKAVLERRLFDDGLTVEDVAREVKLSARYVQQLFSASGITVANWIWHQRLQSARQMLGSVAANGATITEIAHSVGFKDSAHFSRKFKEAFDCSPREYRKKRFSTVSGLQ